VGGIDNSGAVSVTNSTVSGNRAPNSGGGINNSGAMSVTNVTVAYNGVGGDGVGGGINTTSGAATDIANTLVVSNTNGGNCSGGIVDGGYNLGYPMTMTCGFSVGNNDVFGDPRLAPALADNGGPTLTLSMCSEIWHGFVRRDSPEKPCRTYGQVLSSAHGQRGHRRRAAVALRRWRGRPAHGRPAWLPAARYGGK